MRDWLRRRHSILAMLLHKRNLLRRLLRLMQRALQVLLRWRERLRRVLCLAVCCSWRGHQLSGVRRRRWPI